MFGWDSVMRPHRKHPKEKFTPEEDEKLANAVREIGVGMWSQIAERVPKRTTRQCRDRWLYFLSPDIANGPWTDAEDARLREEVERLGCAWRRIARAFATRSEVNVRNRWQAMQRKKLKEMRNARMCQHTIVDLPDLSCDWDSFRQDDYWEDTDFDEWTFHST
jgi:hypothetical protein